MPSCWAGARFEGALRLAVTAYKDEGRRDLRDELARLLGAALTAAADEPAVRRRLGLGEEVLVVPVPTAGPRDGGAATTRSVSSPSRRPRP